MELLRSLHREGTTILIVTHDARYARYARRTVHLFDGRVVGEDVAAPRHGPEISSGA
jgi:putative ABC transport system ATP-binding protein